MPKPIPAVTARTKVPVSAGVDSGFGPAAMSQMARPAMANPDRRRMPGEPSRAMETAAGIAAASRPLRAAEAPIAPRERAT